ncbi:disintegrin and metalloproteinase domain-containing protein 10-like [Sycon ciliatum]|uniref:disintegrin and metalloproteinase domain-containing protein 10-like n=1 Tax=Sycon ciliatum TaxID=27933 RepID=UPI0020A9D8CD|eukprot:scpid38471/ scgid27860/ Disintegrin and metalloproteinase domain-containing protein 10; Kuzbanian protein homolog; Mammalian disintegrin-metalloprotease
MPKPMPSALKWTVGLCVFLLLAQASALPQKRLGHFIRHYEPVRYDKEEFHKHHTDFSRRWQKGETIPYDFTLKLEAHGRVFRLELHPDDEVFARGANFLDGTGNDFEIDRASVLVGRVAGDPSSFVHGSMLNGRFRGIITAFGDKFTVEPSLVHFNDEPDFHTVMYKSTDIDHEKALSKHSCGGHNYTSHYSMPVPGNPVFDGLHAHLEDVGKSRQRRNTNFNYSKIECHINIAGDQVYSEEIARIEALPIADRRRVQSAVVQALALFVREANRIFTTTKFIKERVSDTPEGVKMVIQTARAYITDADMKVFKGTDSKLTDRLLSADSVLDDWAKTTIWDEYCLSYLISHRDFENSILGLAWVSGICKQFDGRVSANTGLVTTQNAGQNIPQTIATLVFAHEIGHNLGAQHDKESRCTDQKAGRFIMFPSANSGNLPNHMRFSACSIEQFAPVLKQKAFGLKSTCFKPDSQGRLCGNGVKEEGEQCDCGAHTECSALALTDRCCQIKTSGAQNPAVDCKYPPTKTCSFQDGPCCSGCLFVPALDNQTCSEPHECRLGIETCDGLSALCPIAPPKANGLVCNRGRATCYGGVCNGSLCAIAGVGVESCDCEGAGNECAVCCKGTDGACKPLSEYSFNKTGINLNRIPGAPCNKGSGHCNFLNFCRRLDDTGVLFQITNTIFSLTTLGSAWDWAKSGWYYILLGVAGLVAAFALMIHFCAKKTPRTVPVTRKGRGTEMKQRF